jgi:hypothetical protein
LDELGIYECVSGGPIPFLLLDAHGSRLQVPFLKYVNDESHKWKVCIGLPNCTGKWQVRDSSQQNGQCKVEMTREKGRLVLFKTRIGTETVIDKSDPIPLVDRVWPKSFGRKETNKTAIRDRGWYPASQMLLHDVDILKTKAASSTASAEEEAAVTVTTNHETDDISDILNVSSGASSTTTSTAVSSSIATAASALDLPDNLPSSTTRKALDNKMNFKSGLAGEFTLDILQHLVKKESVCENLHQRYV